MINFILNSSTHRANRGFKVDSKPTAYFKQIMKHIFN